MERLNLTSSTSKKRRRPDSGYKSVEAKRQDRTIFASLVIQKIAKYLSAYTTKDAENAVLKLRALSGLSSHDEGFVRAVKDWLNRGVIEWFQATKSDILRPCLPELKQNSYHLPTILESWKFNFTGLFVNICGYNPQYIRRLSQIKTLLYLRLVLDDSHDQNEICRLDIFPSALRHLELTINHKNSSLSSNRTRSWSYAILRSLTSLDHLTSLNLDGPFVSNDLIEVAKLTQLTSLRIIFRNGVKRGWMGHLCPLDKLTVLGLYTQSYLTLAFLPKASFRRQLVDLEVTAGSIHVDPVYFRGFCSIRSLKIHCIEKIKFKQPFVGFNLSLGSLRTLVLEGQLNISTESLSLLIRRSLPNLNVLKLPSPRTSSKAP